MIRIVRMVQPDTSSRFDPSLCAVPVMTIEIIMANGSNEFNTPTHAASMPKARACNIRIDPISAAHDSMLSAMNPRNSVGPGPRLTNTAVARWRRRPSI